MRCYMMAQRHDSENFNVVRDLSYLQLYLRQYNGFLESARKGMEMRSNMMVNWATYAFANYLNGDYDFAFRLLESAQKIGATSIKATEKHEILLFQTLMLIKQSKYEEALTFLLDNETHMHFDKTLFNERVVEIALKLNKKETAIEYVNRAFKMNSENAEYYVSYLNAIHDLRIPSFEELLKFSVSNPEKSADLLKTIQEDIKPRIRSRIVNRLELALSTGDKFKQVFTLYFQQNVKQNLPSFFINVKFIYQFQSSKIPTIENIISAHLASIKSKGKLDESLTNGEEMDIVPHLIWVYYYAAQHYDYVRDLENALHYINLAIDSTPSVVEFYMVKSKILKHGGMLEDSAKSYEKAKKLDLGDRYLNAKYAKIFSRIGDIQKSLEIMKEFVRDPLTDENAEHFQCMWYETECGHAYLKNKSILRAHRLFKYVLGHFSTLIEDQFDFYNYCLRRFMINDFANTMEYMDRILDYRYVYKALESYEFILQYLKNNNTKEQEKKLQTEFEEMEKEKLEKYKFKDTATLISELENDLYNFCTKLQSYSKVPHLHHVALKSFLNKGKVFLALKSLIFLQKNAETSFEYLDSLRLFSKYIKDNKEKIDSSYFEIIYEKLNILKDDQSLSKLIEEKRNKLNENYSIQGLLVNVYESVFNTSNTQSLEKAVEQLLQNKQDNLRSIKSEVRDF